jgi:hypothetical protein
VGEAAFHRLRELGSATGMEGGIAILLLLIIGVVAAVLGIALYLTGGALWFGDKGNRRGSDRFERPEHKRVTNESIENTHVVGTRDDD